MGVKRGGGLQGRLRRLTDDMTRELKKAVDEVASSVQADAQISITTGAVSGKGHVPSAPGTPPNNDSGGLANSIKVEHLETLVTQVVVHSPYGAIQELGGTTGRVTLPERPFLRPAAAKNRESGVRRMRFAVDTVLKGGKLS